MSEYEMEKFEESIREKIYSVRGFQVMLDRDLAELYGVETKVLNQAVKRNKERFPEEFCFMLTITENAEQRSQFVTFESRSAKYTKYLPYAFTEQGVAMLSSVLKSKTAVRISIQIMKAFIEMRKFIQSNAQVLHRLDNMELKQIEAISRLDGNDRKFDKIFSLMESGEIKPKQGILFDKQEFDNSHDRFIVSDEKVIYHFGASLKDLGKKWFGFSKMEVEAVEMLSRLGKLK